MYSDEDLDAAVAAGALSAESVAAFRAHMERVRATPVVDEEHFRLVNSFNDIFVAIAGMLVLVAVGWIAGTIGHRLVGAAVALTAWGLAEFFTRKRRMALPSILFLLAFTGGVFATLMPRGNVFSPEFGIGMAFAAAVAAGFTWLHWQRFRVPITVAAGAAALIGVAVGLLLAVTPDLLKWMNAILFAAGIAVFVFAMYWDITDPLRQTRRADVAFWLHLLAAPLIVHPVFTLFGLLDRDVGVSGAVVVMLLYVVMAAIALVIDRRALMVSALVYVLAAISAVLEKFGAVGVNVALTALLIGSALLMLSAFWHVSRAWVVKCLPGVWQGKLPPLR
ncbi:MAG: hypothetical protein K2X06_17090 [Burkholderiales bacterium]|nr:hypothetical protein [Burkholderiales bacterium]